MVKLGGKNAVSAYHWTRIPGNKGEMAQAGREAPRSPANLYSHLASMEKLCYYDSCLVLCFPFNPWCAEGREKSRPSSLLGFGSSFRRQYVLIGYVHHFFVGQCYHVILES